MSNETFYTIAAAMLRERKDCKHEKGRKCIPIETDAECKLCISERKGLIKEMANGKG